MEILQNRILSPDIWRHPVLVLLSEEDFLLSWIFFLPVSLHKVLRIGKNSALDIFSSYTLGKFKKGNNDYEDDGITGQFFH